MPADSTEATMVARLAADEPTARHIIDLLAESFDPLAAVAGASEDGPGRWSVAIHFRDPPNETALRALVALAAGPEAAHALTFETTSPKDWVKASLEGLTPVAAGRFVVHTAHHRTRVPLNRIRIEIEASLAFGTGHHGTTRGCLLALDRILKLQRSVPRRPLPRLHPNSGLPEFGQIRRPKSDRSDFGWRDRVGARSNPPSRRLLPPHPFPARGGGSRLSSTEGRRSVGRRPPTILDLGTGTGVLAIAAARALRQRIMASDIDPVAVRVARANVRLNRAAGFVEIAHADGLSARRLHGRYDLVFANILLGPLQRLATPIARNLAPGGRVVLSGLLRAQAAAALAPYLVHDLRLKQRIPLEGWMTLVLERRGRRGVAAGRSTQ